MYFDANSQYDFDVQQAVAEQDEFINSFKED
jgi:hypothetical protein